MTLTLMFQGQSLKKPYFKNGRADWHGNESSIQAHDSDLCYYGGMGGCKFKSILSLG